MNAPGGYASLIPVNVVTGFLGSGKTTLIARLLRSPALAHTAVMINEFGEVGLDHDLVRHVSETTLLLENGCVCCAIRDDLRESLRDLYSRRERGEVPPFDRLVIETSGLADPMPIAYTVLSEPVLQHHFRLGNVVTTLDACNAAQQVERFPEATQQLVAADRVVVTKTDLATPAEAGELRLRLARINAAAPVFDAADGDLAPSLLFEDAHADLEARESDARRWLAQANAADRDAHHHTEGVSSFCVETDGALDWTAFGVWMTMLLNRHGDRVLRIKGLLAVAGLDGPVLINAAQHVVHPPSHLERWPESDDKTRTAAPSTKIVFIVRDLDCGRIRESLETFSRLASRPAPAVAAAAASIPSAARARGGEAGRTRWPV